MEFLFKSFINLELFVDTKYFLAIYMIGSYLLQRNEIILLQVFVLYLYLFKWLEP